jgi:putative membrane protein
MSLVRGAGESAFDILKKRYAKGEVTKEEFDRIKRDVE